MLTSLITKRVTSFLDRVFGGGQSGFRPVLGARGAVLGTRHPLGRALEREDTVLFLQIDYRSAFDSIPRAFLTRCLRRAGAPSKAREIVSLLYSKAMECIKVDGGRADFFPIRRGVLQGDVLSPVLFILLLHYVLLGEGLNPFPDDVAALRYIG